MSINRLFDTRPLALIAVKFVAIPHNFKPNKFIINPNI